MDQKANPSEPRKHLRDLIQSFSTGMLVTHSEDCVIRARPMTVAGVDDDASVWFATRVSAPKSDEIRSNEQVAVVLQGRTSFVSLAGTATIQPGNTEKARELWKESWRPWFPGGVDDPELAMIRVEVQDAEFWDYRGLAGLRFAFDALRHALKSERMDDAPNTDAHQRFPHPG